MSSDRAVKAMLGIWVAGALIYLSFVGVVIGVAWHFIAKYW